MARALDIPVSRHDSVWSASFQTPLYPPLEKDLRTDVVVVGAGIAGISVAYTLMREGLSVVVLDDGPIGGGITRLTTAHVACAMDFGYTKITDLHGVEGAALAAQSHTAAIDRVERNTRDEGIDCDFERLDGFLFLARGQETSTM